MKAAAIVAIVAWVNLLALTWAIMLGLVEPNVLSWGVTIISILVGMVASSQAGSRKQIGGGK